MPLQSPGEDFHIFHEEYQKKKSCKSQLFSGKLSGFRAFISLKKGAVTDRSVLMWIIHVDSLYDQSISGIFYLHSSDVRVM